MAQITITMNQSDSFGDGWNENYVRIYDYEGAEVASHTLEDGSSGSDTFTLDDNATYTWTFGGGGFPEEASFTMVRDDTGEVLAQASGSAASGSFTLGEASAEDPDISTGLVGRWSFESDGSDSVGSSDGTITGATLTDGHLSLDGSDDFVSIPHDDSHGFGSDDVTVSLWLKTTTTTKSTIWLKAYGDGGGDSLFTLEVNNTAANKLRLFWRNSNAGGSGTCISTDDINDGTWKHVVAVKSASNLLKLYVDGQLDTTASGLSGDFTATLFYLGKWDHQSYNGQDFFNGQLDDFRVYDRALTSADVTALYDAGRDPAEDVDDYPMVSLDSTSESPVGDVGFEKGAKPAFYIYSPQAYDIWFMTGDTWARFQAESYTGGMGFKWPDGATRCYVEMSSAGQRAHMFERDLSRGYFCDGDDADSLADSFHFTGFDYTVAEYQDTVSGQDPIVVGSSAQVVQVIEQGVIKFDYTIVVTASDVTVTPPAGRDGMPVVIRLLTSQ